MQTELRRRLLQQIFLQIKPPNKGEKLIINDSMIFLHVSTTQRAEGSCLKNDKHKVFFFIPNDITENDVNCVCQPSGAIS